MKVTFEVDEEEFLENMLKAAQKVDKKLVKDLVQGTLNEMLASINPPMMKKIAKKYISMESEINYRLREE